MRVVLAEDEKTTRLLLTRMLERWGYEVSAVEDGEAAWTCLSAEDPPRLAVLDWSMPRLDGVELCERLRARESGPYVYVLLITGKTDATDLARGLSCGADDFLRKPLGALEFRARLAVAKRALAHDVKLERYAAQMEELAEARARQLVNQERMATLGLLSAGVAHEINNPASFISGNAQTLERFWQDIGPVVQVASDGATDAEQARKLKFVLREFDRTLEGIQHGVSRISKIVGGLQAYARQKPGERSRVPVGECISRALELCNYQINQAGAEVTRPESGGDTVIRVDTQQIEQVVVNLLVNALHAMEGQAATPRLELRVRAADGRVRVEVEDSGKGVPAEVQARMWDPFFTTKEAGKGTGLGLAICQKIATDHGGSLSLSQAPGRGACFVLEIPQAPASVVDGATTGERKAAAS